MILTAIGYMFGIGFFLMLLLVSAGEIFGHTVVRRFLFWLRGRSEKTGKPVRRFPLFR